MSYDLITIGDSTIDTFIRVHDATVEFDINRDNQRICFPFGSKIPVDAIAYGVAGNAANVAVGAQKLGLSTAIYTNLGDDDQGQRIKSTLEGYGVSGEFIKVNPGRESNLSVVLTFQGERTIFVYHQDWAYQLPELPAFKWVYLTSMAETFTSSNIMDEVCHYIEKTHANLVYGPGTHQLAADVKRYPKLLEKCHLLIVNMSEAKRILNIESDQSPQVRDLLSKMLFLGPKIVVITDGEEGSYATDGQKNLKAGIYPTQVVERTGAGDSYSAGLVSALALGQTLEEAMIWGTVNASHVIQQIGPLSGMMTRVQLEKYRKTMPALVAVTF